MLVVYFLGLGVFNCLFVGFCCLKIFEVFEENMVEIIMWVFYEVFIEWGISVKVFGVIINYGKDIVKVCFLLDIVVYMFCLGYIFNVGI